MNDVNEKWITIKDNIFCDKNLFVEVPNEYTCFVKFDNAIKFRIESGKENLFKIYGKGILGKTITLIFVKTNSELRFLWGVGEIKFIKSNKEYVVGLSGDYVVKFENVSRYLNEVLENENYSLDTLREKSLGVIKSSVINVLGNKIKIATNPEVLFSENAQISSDVKRYVNGSEKLSSVGLKLFDFKIINIVLK